MEEVAVGGANQLRFHLLRPDKDGVGPHPSLPEGRFPSPQRPVVGAVPQWTSVVAQVDEDRVIRETLVIITRTQ